MEEATRCVVCDGKIRRRKRALVAPFLATRIWNWEPFCVDLVQCENCGFQFYNPRLMDAELQNLYRNYRSQEYQRMRQASEPWYTEKFNADLASAASYKVRRAKVGAILNEQLGSKKISRILDYGGDRGDLVAGLLDGAKPFVYDISGVEPAAGVTATSDPAGCKADLVINSNVLEHVGFPKTLVSEILRTASKQSLVYLEVPVEYPFGLTRIARREAQIGVMALTHPSLVRYIVRPSTLYMMHEHVNYFTEQSLTTLMRVCGGAVIASGSYASSGRAGNADMAWCLGRVQ